MTLQILLAGSGGQGLLFAGKLLAYAAMIEDKEVSWFPSYGPAARGGTSNCSVIISDEPIGAPIVAHPEVLIAMNQPSFRKFVPDMQPGGLLVADSSMISEACPRTDIRVAELPATQIAYDEDMQGLANVILIGRLLRELDLFAPETVQHAMENCVPPDKAALLALNLKAYALGYNA